jgi:hypothetical protein
MQDQSDLDTLEALIDTHGLAAIVNSIADICHGKADHLRTNWQDAVAAKSWERDATKLGKVETKLEN